MPIIGLIITLIVLGVVLQLIKPRIDGNIYTLVLVLIILAVCLFILQAFGLFGNALHLR